MVQPRSLPHNSIVTQVPSRAAGCEHSKACGLHATFQPDISSAHRPQGLRQAVAAPWLSPGVQEPLADELEEAYRSGVWLPERGRLGAHNGLASAAKVDLLTPSHELKARPRSVQGTGKRVALSHWPALRRPEAVIPDLVVRAVLPRWSQHAPQRLGC